MAEGDGLRRRGWERLWSRNNGINEKQDQIQLSKRGDNIKDQHLMSLSRILRSESMSRAGLTQRKVPSNLHS